MHAFGSEDWSWLNAPKSWEGADGLTVTTGPDTDFWRTTHYGFVRDTGHVLGRTVDGDFAVTTTFSGAYTDLYDQAGVMLRIDERNWIKTGIEYVDGEQLLSVVVTREVSDWSVVSLPVAPGSVTIAVERTADTVTVRYGLDGAEPATMARLAYFPPAVPVFAGVMCASPQGGGFTVTFDSLKIT
jgi:regulation of enolase protein 1 (concanavalin A-like superfamily)